MALSKEESVLYSSVAEPVGAGTFWSELEPVWRFEGKNIFLLLFSLFLNEKEPEPVNMAPEYHIWYSIPDFKNVIKNLWKH